MHATPSALGPASMEHEQVLLLVTQCDRTATGSAEYAARKSVLLMSACVSVLQG